MKIILDYLFWGIVLLCLGLGGAIFQPYFVDYLKSENINIFTYVYYFLFGLSIFIGFVKITANLGEWKINDQKNKSRLIFYGLIAGIIIIGIGIRLYNLDKLGFTNDEGFSALYSYFINLNGTVCDLQGAYCYIRGLPYHYFVALFTYLGDNSELFVRVGGTVLFTVSSVYLIKYLQILNQGKNTILIAITLFALTDFMVVMSNTARMYIMMFCFLIIFLYYYQRFFLIDNRKMSHGIMLIISGTITILSHELGLLLVYFVFDYILFRSKNRFKSGIIGGIIICLMGFYATMPKLLYFNNNYVGVDNFNPNSISTSFGSLSNLSSNLGFQGFYGKLLIDFIPFVAIFAFMGIIYIIHYKEKQLYPLAGFSIFSLIGINIYNIDLYPRYSRWIFGLLLILASIGFVQSSQNSIKYYLILGISLFISLTNIYQYKNIQYGQTYLLANHIKTVVGEKYYPDDYSFINYLKKYYEKEDIIIYDYWIQDVYLQINNFGKGDYLISKYDPYSYLKAYPYQKIYKEGNNYALYKDGSRFIQSRADLLEIIKNAPKHVYYISSADFIGQRGHTISSKTLYEYIEKNYSVVHTGVDNIHKIFQLK